ncbi:hypothetical protein J1TS3_43990 [Siminovitchia fordii]|uniref:Mutator family transposase n=1 Tax=Siminovitchia fordii TaxID=254759 RepID=A0ABQ4KDI5_9BACI|nr:hypothetical protein J1TS3_43990 [Siminovitchia fordii]
MRGERIEIHLFPPSRKNWIPLSIVGLNTLYFPYLFVDAMYIKVREYQRVVSKAVYIATAINENDEREILSLRVDHSESHEVWKKFLAIEISRIASSKISYIRCPQWSEDRNRGRVRRYRLATMHGVFQPEPLDKLPKKGMEDVKKRFLRWSSPSTPGN